MRSLGCCLLLAVAIALAPLEAQSDADPGIPVPENPFAHDQERSCGPRCVTFLLHYFGRKDTYPSILDELSPGPQGTSIGELERVLRERGIRTRAFARATFTHLA